MRRLACVLIMALVATAAIFAERISYKDYSYANTRLDKFDLIVACDIDQMADLRIYEDGSFDCIVFDADGYSNIISVDYTSRYILVTSFDTYKEAKDKVHTCGFNIGKEAYYTDVNKFGFTEIWSK